MEKKYIEDKAKEALELVNREDGKIDPVAIARQVGFIVLTAILPDSDDGFVIVNPREDVFWLKGDRFIGVNSNRSLERKRFIVAHELGHYYLHCNTGSDLYAMRENKKGKGEDEQAADYFAACLLMPEEEFRSKYLDLQEKGNKKEDIIILLKSKFNVEEECIGRRIEELGL